MHQKVAIWLFLLSLVPAWLLAGTTGKISGVVKDKTTGDPLIGVNIVIDGTLLGASTDMDGYFVILNVPVSEYTVKASYIGYRDVIHENVKVYVDLTTEININMEPSTLDLGEAIVVVADRPLVRKDETNTNIIKSADEIKAMPARGIQNVVATVAGVAKQDNDNVMNVRGGRGNESAVYVDGVLVNDPYNHAVRVQVPNEAIEEMSVQTGGFNAEYGEAMSGIVVITTNSGREKYFGSAEVITDGFLSGSTKTLGTYSYGYNEYVAALGGPIIPGKRHTFFLSGSRRWLKDQSPSWGWAENKDKPADFQNAAIPANNSSDWSFTGKVKLQLAKTMELKSSLIWTDRTFSEIDPIWLYNTQHAPEDYTYSHSFNVTFTHTPGPTTFYDLKLNYYDTFRKLYDRKLGDNLWAYGDPSYNPELNGAWGISYDKPWNDNLDYFGNGAQYNDYFKNRTSFIGIDFDLTHQMGRHHTFKTGFEYKYHTMRMYRMMNPVLLASKENISELTRYRNADVLFYGYDMNGNEANSGNYFEDVVRNENGLPVSGYSSQKPYNPIIMNAYIQDKIEFEDLVLNLGLRYDRIDPNAWQFKQQEARFDENNTPVPGTGMFGGDRIFDKNDVTTSEVHQFLSPRLGVSFPVTSKTIFHVQFGKFYQTPSLADLYLSPFYLDKFVTGGGYFINIDNPNLKPEKTTSYEIGFKQMVSDYASLQLTAFYKETEDLVQLLPVNTDITTVAFSNNGDFGIIKGMDFIFTLRRFKNLSASFNYEMQFANGTGSAYDDNYDIAWQAGNRGNYPKFVMPLAFEQHHMGSVNLDYRLGEKQGPEFLGMKMFQNTGLNMLFSFNSGRPYTRMVLQNSFPFDGRYDVDEMSSLSTEPYSAVNSERMPWVYRLDMKVDRTIPLPVFNSNLNVYLWVLNVLNTQNIMNVWTTTGLADQTGYLQTAAGQAYWEGMSPELQQSYRMRAMDWNNYGIPRQIRLGMRLEF